MQTQGSARSVRAWVCAVAVAAAAALTGPATAATPTRAENWVGAWGYSPRPQPAGQAAGGPAGTASVPLEPPRPPAPPPPPPPPLVENPGGLPLDLTNTDNLSNVTVRELVRVSVGGARLRLRLSSEAGAAPLAIGAVHVGLAGPDGAVTSDRAVTFDGNSGVVVPAGAPLVSDPVELPTRALDRLYVSIHLQGQVVRTPFAPFHYAAGQPGDFTASTALPGARLIRTPVLVTGVEVEPARPTNVLVTLGDSITEGVGSTGLAFRAWPDRLAERLVAAGANWAVVNEGIGGNRLLRAGTGPSALARFDQDVLSVPGLKAIIVLEGVNDIGRGFFPAGGAEPATAKALIAAQKQIIARAHAHGIRVIGATLTPYKGAMYSTAAGEAVRQEYNNWIRTSGAFDAVIDFAAPLANPADPLSIDPRYNDRDHLHPNDAGYKVMAEFVDLSVITGR